MLAAAGGFLTSTNVDARKEAGEPNHAGDSGGSSVWFNWTPSFTGEASIDTGGSDFDTLLAVYTGSAVSSLTPVGSNDDLTTSASTSRACFHATAGATVRIAVDGFASMYYVAGYHGDRGNITLSWGAKSDLAPCPTLPPTVTGSVGAPKVGDVLNLTPGTFADAGATSTQWAARSRSATCPPAARRSASASHLLTAMARSTF